MVLVAHLVDHHNSLGQGNSCYRERGNEGRKTERVRGGEEEEAGGGGRRQEEKEEEEEEEAGGVLIGSSRRWVIWFTIAVEIGFAAGFSRETLSFCASRYSNPSSWCGIPSQSCCPIKFGVVRGAGAGGGRHGRKLFFLLEILLVFTLADESFTSKVFWSIFLLILMPLKFIPGAMEHPE